MSPLVDDCACVSLYVTCRFHRRRQFLNLSAVLNMSNPIPAVGSRISLISSGDIRYEGVLYSIDMVESKIALQQGKAATARCTAQSLMPLGVL